VVHVGSVLMKSVNFCYNFNCFQCVFVEVKMTSFNECFLHPVPDDVDSEGMFA